MSIVCETVRDLIPLYLDGTCSKLTEKFIKRHMQRCKSCTSYCRLCKNSNKASDVREGKKRQCKDIILAPDNGYELIAKRVEKRVMAERIAFIAGAVAAIVTTAVIFDLKRKKDR